MFGELKNTFYDMTRGRVDYAAMKQSKPYADYLKLAARLRAYDLSLLQSREEKLSFWINNDIPGFFRKFQIENQKYPGGYP